VKWLWALLPLALAGCASTALRAPLLRLAPQDLGRTLSVQQHLQFTRGDQVMGVDALLEVDASAVQVALLSLGQTALRLRWDGQQLALQRAPWLPPAVSAEQILSDLQLVLWPIEAITAALPPGWALQNAPEGRSLRYGNTVVSTVHTGPTSTELTQHLSGYRLRITPAGGLP
jgi:hypothetical protein